MKRILLTLSLLFTLSITAQDGYNLTDEAYQAINNKVNKLDSINARNYADIIANSSLISYEHYKTKTRPKSNSASYYYIQSELTTEERQEQLSNGCSKCVTVNFSLYGDSYSFQEVYGSFEYLFDIWKSQFLDSSTADNIESFKYRTVQNKAIGVDVRMSNANGNWNIYNWSN
ncbi:MAG: hypothetical protein ACOH2D_11700 [Gelidibacter sp.]